MKIEKRKFFFAKNEKEIDASVILEKSQMKKTIGGNLDRDPSNDRTYAESTYVRR